MPSLKKRTLTGTNANTSKAGKSIPFYLCNFVITAMHDMVHNVFVQFLLTPFHI